MLTSPEELSVTVRRVQDTIERIVGNGSVHSIRISVTPTGRIVALEIPPEAYDWSPDVLATRITAAHDLASADADEQARYARVELADDPRIRRIVSGIGQLTSR